jgi:hypothetical protein
VAPKWVLKRLALLNSDLRGFLVFVLWNVLFGFGLLAFEDHHYTIVRFYILMGSIGIISVARWLGRVLWPEEWKALEFENRD